MDNSDETLWGKSAYGHKRNKRGKGDLKVLVCLSRLGKRDRSVAHGCGQMRV